jgi:hypothetical protein
VLPSGGHTSMVELVVQLFALPAAGAGGSVGCAIAALETDIAISSG